MRKFLIAITLATSCLSPVWAQGIGDLNKCEGGAWQYVHNQLGHRKPDKEIRLAVVLCQKKSDWECLHDVPLFYQKKLKQDLEFPEFFQLCASKGLKGTCFRRVEKETEELGLAPKAALRKIVTACQGGQP